MTQTFDAIAPEVPRDRWKRPLVQPPEGGKLVAYTRTTTYVGCLEDTYKLGQWQQRAVAIGLSLRKDLLLAASAHRNDRDRLDEICDQAREAAQASAGATTGTALHALTEQYDRGHEIGTVPDDAQRDLDAYAQATSALHHLCIERFMVHDELKIGGTPDRIGTVGDDPKLKIIDVKTGNIEYAIAKIAMQLAVYAHSKLYDPQTYERTELDIDQERAIVVHLPAGSGTCELVEIDIATGWEDVQLATRVRQQRKRKYANLARRLEIATVPAPVPADAQQLGHTTDVPEAFDADRALADRIAAADSIEALTALWHEHARIWTAEHTELARARKSLLSAHVVT